MEDNPVLTVSRKKILEKIRDFLDTKKQWLKYDDPDNALKYHIKAEAFIELLEELDCGSCGGYGIRRGVQQDQRNYQHLENRYKWLLSAPLGNVEGRRNA